MLSDFFMDGQKTTQRRKFVMWVVTVKLLKMTAMSKETSVICIKERNHGKKQARGIWHELCSRRMSVQLLQQITKERG
jgi:hypothetical protein